MSDEIETIRNFSNMLCHKEKFTNEEACRYFGRHIWEYEASLTNERYGYYMTEPCNQENLKKESLFLKCLKKWFVVNKYDFCKISISDKKYRREKSNEYLLKDGKEFLLEGKIISTKYTVKLNDKLLYFYIPEFNPPYINEILISIFDENNESIFRKIDKSYLDLKYPFTIKASSTRKSKDDKYMSNNLLDNNFFTTWVAGGKNAGLNESLVFESDKKYFVYYLFVVNGYVKNRDLFYANNRVKTIKVEFNKEKRIIHLKDTKHYERYPIGTKTKKIKITILDIYKGDKYPEDTCLTEFGPSIKKKDDSR